MSKIVLFHGGCVRCTQQLKHDLDFCYDCQYFEADWSKRDLSEKPETEAQRVRIEVRVRRQQARSSGSVVWN